MSLFSRTSAERDPELIRAILTRGVERMYPSAEFLKERLESGKRLRIYNGIDPTGPTLHLGHLVPLLKLAQFQKLGHEVILLIGDFTATIGDPTDKLAARVPLTERQVLENARLYKKQASAVLQFGGANPAKLKYNSSWLKNLRMADAAKLLASVTHAQTIKRDMFQRRIAEGKDLYLHEFLYPVLQGYDSVAMDVDGEVGGNDQTFNMLMGRDLMKRIRGKEKFVIAMKLLLDAEGKKMGKTEGNMAALSDSASEMFGKIMSWPDSLILPALELYTDLPEAAIAAEREKLARGGNPRDAKVRLAAAIVTVCRGGDAAARAAEEFAKTFGGGGGVPDTMPTVAVPRGSLLAEAALSAGAVSSKSEFRRLIFEGAVTDLALSRALTDPAERVEAERVFKIGKHRFLKVLAK